MKKIISVFIIVLIGLFSLQSPVQARESVQLSSQYAYCYDRDTGLTYIDQKSEDHIYPASMTKILTVSLALDKIQDIKQIVTITKEDLAGLTELGATIAGFYVGEQVTYEDLVYGALLPSGADACYALARLTYGSQENMVGAMNNAVNQLSLQKSHFMNVTGLHDAQHYTTVKDMSTILDHALKNETFVKAFEARKHQSSKKNHTWISSLQRGKEYKNIDITHIDGGKSGFTDEAQLTFASTMTIDTHQLILVTAKAQGQYSQNHVKDAVLVYQYMSQNYHRVILYKKDEELSSYWILKSFHIHYTQIATQDISLLLDQSIEKSDINMEIDTSSFLSAPIQAGNYLGTIDVQYNQKSLYIIDIMATESIESSLLATCLYYLVIIGIPLLLITFIINKIRNRKKKS